MNLPIQPQPGSCHRFLPVLLGLVILAAGVAIGISATLLTISRQPNQAPDQPERFAEQVLRGLNRELSLTPRQRDQLDPVLQEHYRALQEIRAQARPQIVAQLEQLDEDVASVLTPDQHQIWQQHIVRLEDHFPALRERRGQGRGGQGRGAGVEPSQRGPHGPREPLGPGLRRNGGRGNEPTPAPQAPSQTDALPPHNGAAPQSAHPQWLTSAMNASCTPAANR